MLAALDAHFYRVVFVEYVKQLVHTSWISELLIESKYAAPPKALFQDVFSHPPILNSACESVNLELKYMLL